MNPPPKKEIIVTMAQIIGHVASSYDVTVQQIKGRERPHKVTWPRQVCMYLGREMLHQSFATIGEPLGNRDHGTVMHGHERVSDQVALGSVLGLAVKKLREQLESIAETGCCPTCKRAYEPATN